MSFSEENFRSLLSFKKSFREKRQAPQKEQERFKKAASPAFKGGLTSPRWEGIRPKEWESVT